MVTKRSFIAAALAAIACLSVVTASAQTKRRKVLTVKKKPAAIVNDLPDTQPIEPPAVKTPPKKNERPGDSNDTGIERSTEKQNPRKLSNPATPVYFYEFAQPNFLVTKIRIEHDETGAGTIAFMKRGSDEMITDPLQLTPATMDRLRGSFAALNFLDSTEDYQYKNDYSHLGTMKLTVRKSGRERTSAFNYTENKDAKAVTDEYRKVGNQFIWMFDINLARENQPLQAPGIVDELDSLIRRKEISDPGQLVPFLQRLTEDERIPLIARNHAGKIIKQIEKQVEKERK
jgi:hypothetical protein